MCELLRRHPLQPRAEGLAFSLLLARVFELLAPREPRVALTIEAPSEHGCVNMHALFLRKFLLQHSGGHHARLAHGKQACD